MATARKSTKAGRTTPRKIEGALEVTSAQQWRGGSSEGTPLRVPSGNVCLVRQASGLNMFLTEGKIPNPLLPIVEKALKEGKEPTQEDFESVANGDIGELMKNIGEMADRAALFLVMEPALYAIPLDSGGNPVPFARREQIDGLWIDEIDFEDKMFIFNYAVGGPTDVETFRSGQAGALESVSGR